MKIIKVFTTHLGQNLIVKMIKIKIKTKQNSNIDTKPPNIFHYLKSPSQEAKDLIDEIEEADNDIDDYKLFFIGSNKEKFNFDIELSFSYL